MEDKSSATLENILHAALEEFSDKGFLGASLRQIVKKAGVTTGAFYGYFSSKEALFAAIVEPHAAALMGKFMEAQTSFAELPEEQQPDHMGVESSNCIHWMVEYTLKYMEVLRRLGHDIPELDEQMCHIIASGMFNGIFEIVVHDMPRDRALRYVDQLRDFYTAGWLKLMGQ